MINNCPYCNGEKKPIFEELDAKLYIYDGWIVYRSTLYFDNDGEKYGMATTHYEANNLNYCPVCGRKIKKEGSRK